MFEPMTFEERMRRHHFRMASWDLANLDMRLFSLESRLRRLELDWPGSSPDEQRRLRKQRMEARYDLELLKIDLKKIERRTEALDANS